MRIKPGTTIDEVVSTLTDTQQRALLEVVLQADRARGALTTAETAQEKYADAVRSAFESGVPVVVMASQLALTRTRIYQIINDK